MSKFSTNQRSLKTNSNDIIYTPKSVAIKMIDMCSITSNMKVLDCCKGGGVFFDNLNNCNKEWCEITEGKDFFDYNERVDLVIGNPPYSLWSKWIEHTMEITDKFCYIMGCFNFTDKRIRDILNKGFGITKIHIVKIDWWYSVAYVVIFEKDKESIITVEPKVIMCENCGKRCKRGRVGNDMNICSLLN